MVYSRSLKRLERDEKPPLILTNTLLFCYCGISITAGYHRLWSHKAYKAHPILQWIFVIGALTLQNSALHWSSLFKTRTLAVFLLAPHSLRA